MFERKPTPAEFDGAIIDFLRTLQSLNLELNGERPSETIQARPGAVPRAAAYAISQVTTRLRSQDRADAAQSVEVAWDAVLAGDVDDV